MPISKHNRHKYPYGWKIFAKNLILTRNNDSCEICNYKNGTVCPVYGSVIQLQVMHKDHTPENIKDENLLVACRGYHNKFDGKHRVESRFLNNPSRYSKPYPDSLDNGPAWITNDEPPEY